METPTPSPEQSESLRSVLATLQPVLMVVDGNQAIKTELESEVVQLAISCLFLLREHTKMAHWVQILLTRRPVPLAVARWALSRQISVPDGFADRLLAEHPHSTEAVILAALIKSELLGRHREAFEMLLPIAKAAESQREREQSIGLLSQVAMQMGSEELSAVEDLARSILLPGSRLFKMLRAQSLLRMGQQRELGDLLEEIRDEDDPVWLQLCGHHLVLKGDGASAIAPLFKAGKQLNDFHLLQRAAGLAHENHQPDVAVDILETLLQIYPQDRNSRQNAAMIYLQLEDMCRAAKHLGVLYEAAPEDVRIGLNYAVALARSGQPEASLSIYERLCSASKPPATAVLGRAHLLKAIDRPREAFASMNAMRHAYWDVPEFVQSYLSLAYAAGEEDAGHQALLRLMELQSQGKAGREMLQAKSLEDVREYAKEYQDRFEKLHRLMLQGQAPWLMIDELLGRVAYMGWYIRTQACNWIPDEPLARAQYCVYSTNSFTSVPAERAGFELRRIVCPPQGCMVVADLTALITLHRLALLAAAVSYFGKIAIPASCMTHMLDEHSRLVFHQLSQKTSRQNIKTAIDEKKIRVLLEPGSPGQRPLPFVNEHTLDGTEEEHLYRLKDVVFAMQLHGQILPQKVQSILAVAHKMPGSDESHPQLQVGQALLFDLLTLMTLDQFDVMTDILASFVVNITPADYDGLLADLRGIAAQEDLRSWHRQLWDFLRSDSHIVQIPVAPGKQYSDMGSERMGELWLDATRLSSQLKAPLLIDDRTCQALVLNERRQDSNPAFGTDCVVLALLKGNVIDVDIARKAMLQLVEWRYRFLLPDRQILKAMADAYREHPPGRDLRAVASYLHDCMGDPGLFGGPERTDPPMAMATKLLHSWIALSAELLVDVWGDKTWLETDARALTEWIIAEMLPSIPKALGPRGHQLARFSNRLFLSQVMIGFCLIRDLERAASGLEEVSRHLGLNRADYLKAVTGVIDGI
jgi:hypothetical protein